MDLELEGKRALITGSSRGIGFAIAKKLADEGCVVTICGRDETSLKQAKAAIYQMPSPGLFAIPTDLSKRGASAALVEQAVKSMGGLDLLVNNVGSNRRKPFEDTTDQDWDELLDINFRGPLEATRAAIPYLKQEGGSVIFNASIFGREFGGQDMSLYHVTKGALISLSKSLAMELVSDGIRVNTLAPGSTWFEGGSWDKRLKQDPVGMREFIAQNLPAGRFGKAEEIADAAAFLLSERASWVNGTCWNVDGGQSRSMI